MDGMKPISFGELKARLEACGVYEDQPPSTHEAMPDVHFFTRMVMGLGVPYVPVIAESDTSTIAPPTIIHTLRSLGVSPVQFWSSDP